MPTSDSPDNTALPTVEAQKQAARKAILEQSIDQDQMRVIDRWSKTFAQNDTTHKDLKTHTRASLIMMLSMAAVAEGEFKVRAFESEDYSPPTDILSITDYFSHGSRVIIDYSELTPGQSAMFLAEIPKDQLDARASTHYTESNEDMTTLAEGKSILHGAAEAGKIVVDVIGERTGISHLVSNTIFQGPELTDYGINIMMGGLGQPNLSGGISEMGRDGHVFLHFGSPNTVLIGLEQTKPPLTAKDYHQMVDSGVSVAKSMISTSVNWLMRKSTPSPEPEESLPSPGKLAADNDNSGGLSGSHSMLGHSDDYTSAGSLYFSNLIYKIKLLAQKGTLTPAKYNGMKVKLTQSNFKQVMDFFKRLKSSPDQDTVSALLRQIPSSHERVERPDGQNTLLLLKNLEPKDISAMFKQLKSVYGENFPDTAAFEQKLRDIQDWMGTPRALPKNSRLLLPFADGDILSTNEIVQLLKQTFDNAVFTLQQQADVELRTAIQKQNPRFKLLDMMLSAYSIIGADTEQKVYKQLETQFNQLIHLRNRINKRLKEHRDLSVYNDLFPFGYLIQLDELYKIIDDLLTTNESKIIIRLHTDNVRLVRKLEQATPAVIPIHPTLEEPTVLNETRQDASLSIEDQPPENHEEQEQRVPIDLTHERNEAQSHANDEEQAQTTPIESVLHHNDTAQRWDWHFFLQCVTSKEAYTAYGCLLIISSLLLVATASVVPLSLGAVAAGLGSFCFFKAGANSTMSPQPVSITPQVDHAIP